MLLDDAFLNEKTLQPAGLEKKPTRDGFGHGSVEAGKADLSVVVLSADLSESTRAEWFQKEFPDRFIEMGVAEQNMATVASGLANYGKIPFITSYAAFSPGRNWEQIRTTICINNVPVIVCGMHAGVSVGPDGATHQMLEDIALMRALPNMTVVVPADAEEGRKATIAAAKLRKPIYLRFGRTAAPVFTTQATPFAIGRANVLWDSSASGKKPQVTLVACGSLVHSALVAAHTLEEKGIASIVINNHTIKPLDADTILAAVKKTGAVVSIEEHQITGGMGSAVAELLSQRFPVPQEYIGVHDMFGQSGEPDELIEHYGMGVDHIVSAAQQVIGRK
jgi:transketolase